VPLYEDPDYARLAINAGGGPMLAMLRVALRHGRLGPSRQYPALFRGVHDGRYKFARYFKPAEHHIPRDWETLLRHNELELYDTQADPDELVNLAREPEKHRVLITALNERTNALIGREVGIDDGASLPGPRLLYKL
jgi:arylsulfatase